MLKIPDEVSPRQHENPSASATPANELRQRFLDAGSRRGSARRWLAGAVFVGLAALSWWIVESAGGRAPTSITPSAVDGHLFDIVKVPGRVEPIDGQLHLAFDTLGILRKMHVAEGDWVEADKALAELVNDELRARVDAARHEADESLARLRMLENGPRVEEMDEAEAQLNRASAITKYFASVLDRREQLFRRKAIAEEEVLDYRQRAEAALKEEDAAGARLRLLKAGTRVEEIQMANAECELKKARVRELEAALERTTLRAPRAGKILRVLRREGESVMGLEAMPVILMADIQRLQVRAEVNETQIGLVSEGNPVQIEVPGLVGQTIPGEVVRISQIMGRKQIVTDDPREKVDTRVLEVIVAPKSMEGLLINQRVDVTIRTAEPVAARPNSASISGSSADPTGTSGIRSP